MDSGGNKIWLNEHDMLCAHFNKSSVITRYGYAERNKQNEIVWINLKVNDSVFRIKHGTEYIKNKTVWLPRWVLTLPPQTKIMQTSYTRRWASTVEKIKANCLRFRCPSHEFLRQRVMVPMSIGVSRLRKQKKRINKLNFWKGKQ